MAEWNRILREKQYSREEPDESAVSFVTLLKKNNKNARILDIGFGAGRNLTYVAEQGLEAHGIDISETGINITKERLKKQNLEANILKGNMNHLPYIESCFDAVICLFTIYHQKFKGIQTTVSEVHRVLKKGGNLLVNFQSKRSGMYGNGTELEKDTFIRQNGPEKGVIHHFTDKKEIAKFLGEFKNVNTKLHEQKSADGYLQSRLIVIAKA